MALQKGMASHGNAEFPSSSTLFHPGVKVLMPDTKTQGAKRLLILPDYEEGRSPADPATKVSWSRYRRPGDIDGATGCENFASWYSFLRRYAFLGNTGMGFWSPTNHGEDPNAKTEDMYDPVHMCREVARQQNSPWKYLTEKQPLTATNKYGRPVIPMFSTSAVMNVAAWDVDRLGNPSGMVDNHLCVISHSGFEFIAAQLNEIHTIDSQPGDIDPNWPRYKLGDVTAPDWGRVGYFHQAAQVGNAQAATWTIAFTNQMTGKMDQFARAMRSTPWQNTEMAQRLLAGRYDYTDDKTVVVMLSTQKIVDMIVADGFIPRELLLMACGNVANVPVSTGPSYNTAVTGFPGAPEAYEAQRALGMPAAHAAPYGAPGAAMGVPAFGGQPAPAVGFGGPAAGGYGSPLPAPAFGAPPSAPAPGFGGPAAPAPGFGAPPPGFGGPAAPAPGFGGPAAPGFGGPAAPAPQGFGQPAPAVGFGGPAAGGYGSPLPAPAFGAPPSAPAPGFGGPPAAPAPPSFGTPAAAPVVPKSEDEDFWMVDAANPTVVSASRTTIIQLAQQGHDIRVSPKVLSTPDWKKPEEMAIPGLPVQAPAPAPQGFGMPSVPTQAPAPQGFGMPSVPTQAPAPQATGFPESAAGNQAPLSVDEIAELRALQAQSAVKQPEGVLFMRMIDLSTRATVNKQTIE